MSKTNLRIIELRREPARDPNDTLVLADGLNVITGEKDAGKTVWLRMLDYLMGDDDVPEDAFGVAIAIKYDSLHARIAIGDDEYLVERKWKEKGLKTKVFLKGEALNADEFCRSLLSLLGIPLVRFPKGNPYEDRTWPELSWRMLFRHVYRQERFWGDFAEKQPDVEQHACVCQFMGVASQVFPREYGELVTKQKALMQLQGQVANYSHTLQLITSELLHHEELSVVVTEESIERTEQRILGELEKLKAERTRILGELEEKRAQHFDKHLIVAKQKRADLQARLEGISKDRVRSAERAGELMAYQSVLKGELSKLRRAQVSGELMADLKVTQCPACDQKIAPTHEVDVCYLCGRRHSLSQHDVGGASKRIAFEVDRILEENSELDELIWELSSEIDSFEKSAQDATRELRFSERELSSAAQAADALVPPDYELISQQEGKLMEQLRQLRGVREAVNQKRCLVAKIDEMHKQEGALKAEIDALPTPDFGALSLELEDGMNSYLNQVAEGNKKRWEFPPLSVSLKDHSFNVRIGKRKWNTQLGITSQALVLFAYHYALLSLSSNADRNYPGIVIIDFPMELADADSVGSSENYLLEPFVRLCEKLADSKVQVIATGRSFRDLVGATQIHLERDTLLEVVPDEVIDLENASERQFE